MLILLHRQVMHSKQEVSVWIKAPPWTLQLSVKLGHTVNQIVSGEGNFQNLKKKFHSLMVEFASKVPSLRPLCLILEVSSSMISLMMVLTQNTMEEAMQCMKANLATCLDRLTMTLEYLNIMYS